MQASAPIFTVSFTMSFSPGLNTCVHRAPHCLAFSKAIRMCGGSMPAATDAIHPVAFHHGTFGVLVARTQAKSRPAAVAQFGSKCAMMRPTTGVGKA